MEKPNKTPFFHGPQNLHVEVCWKERSFGVSIRKKHPPLFLEAFYQNDPRWWQLKDFLEFSPRKLGKMFFPILTIKFFRWVDSTINQDLLVLVPRLNSAPLVLVSFPPLTLGVVRCIHVRKVSLCLWNIFKGKGYNG